MCMKTRDFKSREMNTYAKSGRGCPKPPDPRRFFLSKFLRKRLSALRGRDLRKSFVACVKRLSAAAQTKPGFPPFSRLCLRHRDDVHVGERNRLARDVQRDRA